MYASPPLKTMAVKNPFTFLPEIAISSGHPRLLSARCACQYD
jgi:hypothetical protein